jgi:hypothetical protein
MNLHEKFSKLREAYPDDVVRIEAEEKRVSEVLKKQEYYELAETKTLLALCRKDVVKARMTLATDRTLTDEQRSALWHLVDSREWFLKLVSEDYKAQLEQIDRELEAELTR